MAGKKNSLSLEFRYHVLVQTPETEQIKGPFLCIIILLICTKMPISRSEMHHLEANRRSRKAVPPLKQYRSKAESIRCLSLVWVTSLFELIWYGEKYYNTIFFLNYWDTRAVSSVVGLYAINTTFETFFENTITWLGYPQKPVTVCQNCGIHA